MYYQQKSFGGNRRSGGGQGQSRGGFRSQQRSSHKRGSFDPSLLIRKAVVTEAIVYEPKHSFSDFNLIPELQQNIERHGYDTPTPIQDQVIPEILAGKDVIGIAGTGTGKTAAFLIPLIHNLVTQKSSRVLIMAPTRELAVQIQSELKLFSSGLQISSALCIGGAPIRQQLFALQRDVDFVIGTPGRLLDLEERRALNFADFNAVVLDEVDQMFDMGFIRDIKYIVGRLPQERNSLFFSATLPDQLRDVIHTFLHNPSMITIQKQQAAANVNQDVVLIRSKSKVDLLHGLLIQEGFDKVLVFGSTKFGLDKLARVLDERNISVAVIHGNKSHPQRQKALSLFKLNKVQVLLATDVASRGLHIDDVTHVINYDLPQTYEDYIHRIGRTGRGNKTGIALSFVEG